ncbi:MAG TPA: hypothetical protein VH934_09580 [Xanthobacteraceae bacterium]|jgi:hypothetical protein
MSSPKRAAARAVRRPPATAAKRAAAQPADERAPAPGAGRPARAPAAGGTSSAQATRLAAEIEGALASGRRDLLSAPALQALMAAMCKTYAARVDAGEELLPLPERGGATATDVMITASGLLKAANLAVFELGMWQSWTGR